MAERRYESVDWYHVRDRGWVANVMNHPRLEWDEIEAMSQGSEVVIDGHTYTCRGVEKFAIGGPAYPQSLGIGLLIEGERKDG